MALLQIDSRIQNDLTVISEPGCDFVDPIQTRCSSTALISKRVKAHPFDSCGTGSKICVATATTQSPPPCKSRPTNHLIPNSIKSKNGLKIAHLNIWSLRRKIDQVTVLLHDRPFDMFALSETYLTCNVDDSELSVDGYTFYRRDRGSRGGGVALYVANDLTHELCTTINDHVNIEAMWVKVNVPYHKPIFVCTVYRPPSADDVYFENMLQTFENVISDDNDVVIVGDFNFDYVIDETLANNQAHYIELLLNCSQLIQVPTRVTPTTSSTIDLIYSSVPDHHSESGTINCTMSDHSFIPLSSLMLNVQSKPLELLKSETSKTLSLWHIILT